MKPTVNIPITPKQLEALQDIKRRPPSAASPLSVEDMMRVSEKIYEEVNKLPEPLQAEVLDFVQYLASKLERQSTSENELGAASLSLSLAMRGMEDEETPSYSTNDLREAFQ